MGRALSTVHLYRNGSLHNPVHATSNNLGAIKETIKPETVTAADFYFLTGEDIWTKIYQYLTTSWAKTDLHDREEIESKLQDNISRLFAFVGKVMSDIDVEKAFDKEAGTVANGVYAVTFDENGKPIDYRKLNFNGEAYVVVDTVEELRDIYLEITGTNLIYEKSDNKTDSENSKSIGSEQVLKIGRPKEQN